MHQLSKPPPDVPSPDLAFYADPIARVIEAIGIGVIAFSVIVSTIIFLLHFARKRRLKGTYHRYRSNLGRGVLLGLEFLVAADIVGTVAVEPSFENLGILGLIVLIRTFLSFSLGVEINGYWPWQARKYSHRHGREAQPPQ